MGFSYQYHPEKFVEIKTGYRGSEGGTLEESGHYRFQLGLKVLSELFEEGEPFEADGGETCAEAEDLLFQLFKVFEITDKYPRLPGE